MTRGGGNVKNSTKKIKIQKNFHLIHHIFLFFKHRMLEMTDIAIRILMFNKINNKTYGKNFSTGYGNHRIDTS